MRNGLVVAQVALALVLLFGSGLMARSFLETRSVDPGFRPGSALTFRIALPPAEYATGADAARFHQQVVDRIAALPGVQAVGAITSIPLTNELSNNTGTWVEDHPVPEGGIPRLHRTHVATPGYFAAMGIPLEAGRAFVPADHERRSGAAIVSRAFARRYWPNGSPIGRRLRGGPEAPWSTIVGVVGDVHEEALTKPAEEMVYFPMVGLEGDSGWTARSMAYVVRTAGGDPTALAPLARREVWALDRNLPIVNIRPLSQIVSDAMARTSFILVMVGLAAGIALVLGAVGIYGVISYMVSLRTREIGVRMALGARAGQVRRMIVRQGLTLGAIGVAIGVVGGIVLARLFSAFLYGVRPADPLTLGATSGLLLLVAAIASFLPAHRASRIDPTDALRGE